MFVGNEKAQRLLFLLSKTKMPHFLVTGPPGHGKSTLIKQIAHHLVEINSNNIQNLQDLYACLKQVQENSFLFFDEMHALPEKIQEALYPLMDSCNIQKIDRRNQQKTDIQFPCFTICGATTKEHKLTNPLRSRLLIIRLQPYEKQDLIQIAKNHLPNVSEDVISILAHYSRASPRELIKLCNLFKQTNGSSTEDAYNIIEMLDVFPGGLNRTELKILLLLKNGPISLSGLAAKLLVDESVLTDEHEMFLIQNGLIQTSKRGRELTNTGISYLNYLRKLLPNY